MAKTASTFKDKKLEQIFSNSSSEKHFVPNTYTILNDGETILNVTNAQNTNWTFANFFIHNNFSVLTEIKINEGQYLVVCDDQHWKILDFNKKIVAQGLDEVEVFVKKIVRSEGIKQRLLYSSHSIYSLTGYPIQLIYYGAPGTGKSHKTNEVTSNYPDTVRTTFHPDSDYSTFVGAYKPTMEEVEARIVPVVTTGGITLDQNNGTYKEKKIVYKFIKQAFLKAYILAWKKFANAHINHSSGKGFVRIDNITCSGKNVSIQINRVNEKSIEFLKEEEWTTESLKSSALKIWKNRWIDGKYNNVAQKSGAGKSEAVCNIIKAMIGKEELPTNEIDASFENGWKKLIDKINTGESVEIKAISSTYILKQSSREGTIVIVSNDKYKIDTAADHFENEEKPDGIQGTIWEKLKDYSKEDFPTAIDTLKKELQTKDEFVFTPQFLVIEEINRGNCAQIFGDLFQLLDRKNNFSEYPIEADDDIRKALLDEDTEENPSFGKNGLQLDDEQKAYIDSIFEGKPYADKICKGQLLVLPPNLYIWATMNTSDQSLFPIDSAFKRRWEWKYMKIKRGKDEQGNALDWKIEVRDTKNEIVKINGKDSLSWWEFLQKINEIIASMTSSVDKQLGYFFCKAENDVISGDSFVSKVIFYLWNDVFKDYGFEDESLFRYEVEENGKEEKKDLTFPDFYDEDGENVNTVRLVDFLKKIMNWQKPEEEK